MRHQTVGMVRIVMVLAVGAVIACAFFRRPVRQDRLVELDSGRVMMMGTFARIRIRCAERVADRDVLERALAAAREVERLMSTYREDSELSAVNRLAARQEVKVSPETFHLLEKARDYSRITDGAFDITVTPLLDVWKRSAAANRQPTSDELADAARHVGWRKVILSGPAPMTVRFADPGVRINVDAIAKGYGVDRALQSLRVAGVSSALVNIGGEIACFGDDWIIGIQDPFAGDNDNPLRERPRWRVKCRDAAVATSGNYRRYVTIDGRKVSHIVDPRTGRPADTPASVTIIADQTVDADALATAVSVMGPEKGLALIESLEDTEAFIVAGTEKNVRVYRSSGFSRYELAP